jgi:uncharacterized protein YyaL (SSP411 family)
MNNRLQDESSPYLRQHADNPVHWQPWDDAALTAAREQDKPILLSIGYSACHWCHVMAHESFEDSATAALMNDCFVNIKVDREERPDLDKVYQLAHQVLTQQGGGWPLTMFLDPHSLLPFFGGTYFPKSARAQIPGFTDLLGRINDAWQQQRDALGEQGEKLRDVFARLNESEAADQLADPAALADKAIEQLNGQYDASEGGFGTAPKFPMASTLAFLLHQAVAKQNRQAMDMVMTTLTRMARGGIYDHLGGGFFRYATDRAWAIPHFEKMLYDNGQLLSLYADAVIVGPDELFANALRETAGWLAGDMASPEGAFYAARDADSEGQEGHFYLWRRDEIKKALSEDEYLIIETLYGIDKPANFENRWNLARRDAWRSVVERLSLERDQADTLLSGAKQKLLALRQQRIAPGLDDKVLTAWNAMTIKGLAKTSIALGETRWLEVAQRCADFLREQLFDGDTLYASWQGQARFPAYLDDYANLMEALLTLLSAEWRETDAAFVRQLADRAVARFQDPEHGGFFFTHDRGELFHQPKPTMDDALPPGNGVIAQALIQLGHLFGENEYLEAAERALYWANGRMLQYPAGHCSMLGALEQYLEPAEQIIIRGPREQLDEWLELARGGFAPNRRCYGIPYDGVSTLPGYLPRLVSIEEQSRPVAYRCENFSCSLPIRSLDELKQTLTKR